MSVLFAGDWHGELRAMRRAVHFAQKNGCSKIIQVGDFGYGWKILEPDRACWFTRKCAAEVEASGVQIDWIDGNHENFDLMEEHGFFHGDGPQEILPGVRYLPRGTVIEEVGKRILAVGGAYSVDKAGRIPHVSWWAQEELTAADVEKSLEAEDIDIVLSHDAPDSAFGAALLIAAGNDISEMGHLVWKNDHRFPGARPNRMALEAILQHHHPKYWLHGHYHANYEADLRGGTHVIGLDFETQDRSLAILMDNGEVRGLYADLPWRGLSDIVDGLH